VQASAEGFEELSMIVRYLLLVGDEAARGATVGVLDSVLGAQQKEELMLTVGEKLIEQGRELGRVEGRVEGRVQGRAEDVLRILAARGVSVDERARQRILLCKDLALLDQWFDRALKATQLSEVLDGRIR
jgi:hypothetical protein